MTLVTPDPRPTRVLTVVPPLGEVAAPDTSVDPGDILRVADAVLEIARTDPDRTALIRARHRPVVGPRYRRTTYATLSRRAEALAVGLRQLGVAEGTRCSFMVPPSEDALVLALALWRVGAVIVGIEPHSHGLRAVGRSLARAEPEVFFGTPAAHAARRAFGWGAPTVRSEVVVGGPSLPHRPSLRSLERRAPADPRRAAVGPDDAAVIAFTTGSTGAPKPTVMTHRNLAAMVAGIRRQWGLDDGAEVVDMATFPMFWVIGLSVGGTVVIPPMDFTLRGPGHADPARLVRTIRDCGVRSMFASPALLTNLADHCEATGTTLPSLRRIVAGGAEVPGPLFARVRPLLGPGGDLHSDYGATEALPVSEIAGATVVGETWARTEAGAGLCVGRPLHGVEVRIVAATDGPIATIDAATPLAAGEIGEVIARSPHISARYFRAADDDAANKIEDPTGRWHRIGDCGYLDADGRLWICGRRSHRVVTATRTLYPLCCEPVANTHPAVARSALVGVNRPTRTAPTLCVELIDPDTADRVAVERELRTLLQGRDSTVGIERIVFVDRLPVDRRHNAKIDRPALAASLAGA